MVDFNQALRHSRIAMTYALALDHEEIYWIEEPIRHDNYRHMALLAQSARTPIQIGENFTGLPPWLLHWKQALLTTSCWIWIVSAVSPVGSVPQGSFSLQPRDFISSIPRGKCASHGSHARIATGWNTLIGRIRSSGEPLQIREWVTLSFPDRPGNGIAWRSDVVAKYRLI